MKDAVDHTESHLRRITPQKYMASSSVSESSFRSPQLEELLSPSSSVSLGAPDAGGGSVAGGGMPGGEEGIAVGAAGRGGGRSEGGGAPRARLTTDSRKGIGGGGG